ncbi:hypothetical protein F2Q69_00051239 [Brassica cretica]|uniref:Uncharacterized protein n=1 Tax=Brassica cretica TaxID=69181 RepID=A0A8S9PHX8_BRACR|nr:hypothetical protein F2Q69_00051239 [Brassica cretica]
MSFDIECPGKAYVLSNVNHIVLGDHLLGLCKSWLNGPLKSDEPLVAHVCELAPYRGRKLGRTRAVWNGLASGHGCVLRYSDAIGARLLLI